MECTVTQDDLKILLLKCVGSRYPIKIILKDNVITDAYMRGFADSDCTVMILSDDDHDAFIHEIKIQDVKSIETMKQISLDRVKGKNFKVN